MNFMIASHSANVAVFYAGRTSKDINKSQESVPVLITSEPQLNPILYSIHLNLISLDIKQGCDRNRQPAVFKFLMVALIFTIATGRCYDYITFDLVGEPFPLASI